MTRNLKPYLDAIDGHVKVLADATGVPIDLIAFHRRTFGGYRMTTTPPETGGSGDDGQGGAGSNNGDQGSNNSGQGSDNSGQGSNNGDQGSDKGQQDLGFPKDTPLTEMTPVQQAAYYKHQNRKAEQRANSYHQAVGGKTPEQVAADLAELDRVKRDQMTEQQRAVEDARREATEETRRQLGVASARSMMDLLLGPVPNGEDAGERAELLDTLDFTKVLTDSGEVDTAKVRKLAEKIAPTGRETGGRGRLDFGGGRERGHSRPASGLQAGADRYAARKGKDKAQNAS